MAEGDKYKSCEGCTERSVFPNCHSTCKGYLSRVKERETIRKNRRKAGEYDSYVFDNIGRTRKQLKRYIKNKKKYR